MQRQCKNKIRKKQKTKQKKKKKKPSLASILRVIDEMTK